MYNSKRDWRPDEETTRGKINFLVIHDGATIQHRISVVLICIAVLFDESETNRFFHFPDGLHRSVFRQ